MALDVRMPPGFEAVEILGKGAMGQVFKAWQPKLQRFVAIKTCNIAQSRENGQDPGRLEDEALTIARLNHPNIVALHDVVRDEESIYLIMELLDGLTLAQLFNPQTTDGQLGDLQHMLDLGTSEAHPERSRILLDRWLCEIGIAVARALEYAHSRGVLHRDVKPGNIIINRDRHIKLFDFSIARSSGQAMSRTATGMVFGTVSYMSPEQILSTPLDGRADVYSLGCTLFHAATGCFPYDSDNEITICMNHVNADVPDPRLLSNNLHDDIGRVIMRCMAKTPADRFSSAAEVANLLGSIMRGESVNIPLDGVFRPHSLVVVDPPTVPAVGPPVSSTAGTRVSSGLVGKSLDPPSNPVRPSSTANPASNPISGVSAQVASIFPDTGSVPAPPVKRKDTTKKLTLESLAYRRSSSSVDIPREGPLGEHMESWADDGPSESDVASLPSVRKILDSARDAEVELRRRRQRFGILVGVIGGGILLVATGVILLAATAGSDDSGDSSRAGIPAIPTPINGTLAFARTPTPTPEPTPEPTPVPIALPPVPTPDPAIHRFQVTVGGDIRLFLRELPAGSFTMGSAPDEPRAEQDEAPRTTVKFPYPFYLSETEITQGQWFTVMPGKPSPGREEEPVSGISWDQASDFCRRLSERTGLTFELPTEAQWEYACRAGTVSPFSFGPILTSEVANIDGTKPYPRAAPSTRLGRISAVASFPANQWGLFDMHGNVWEWTRDAYAPKLLGDEVINPLVTSRDNSRRTVRGGGYDASAAEARSASRRAGAAAEPLPATGFRVVVEL